MAGALTISTLNNDTGVLATQNGMTGIDKAWVYYNPTTQTIIGSFNVSSVTYSGAGNFVANFTTAMPNANYAAVVSSTYGSSISSPTTTSCGFNSYTTTNGTGANYLSSLIVISS